MNPIITRTRDAMWAAITAEVPLTPDANILWGVMLDSAICERRQGLGQRVINKTGWHYSTTVSRLIRLSLPSVNDCVDWISLAYAAALFGGPDDRIASVAYTLGHATPQSFGRNLKELCGWTPARFRDEVSFSMARELILDQIVRPYREEWAEFTHLSVPRFTTPPRSLAAA